MKAHFAKAQCWLPLLPGPLPRSRLDPVDVWMSEFQPWSGSTLMPKADF
jgi:hypothetical protein